MDRTGATSMTETPLSIVRIILSHPRSFTYVAGRRAPHRSGESSTYAHPDQYSPTVRTLLPHGGVGLGTSQRRARGSGRLPPRLRPDRDAGRTTRGDHHR